MRVWIAARCLVPSLSWGIGCHSVENLQYYLHFAQVVIDLRDKGVAETQVPELVIRADASPWLQASMLEAVEIESPRVL